MMHLMRLELKKIHFKKYIFFSALAIVLSMYFVFVSLYDTSEHVRTFENTFQTVELIFAFIFVIFFSVLNAAIVISEYNNKTILSMFTYPIDKKKMVTAKLLLITIFMAVSMLIGYAACSLFIIGIDKRFDLLDGEFSFTVLENLIYGTLATTIVFCCLGLWTFAVGMIKKSVSMTIVSSMIFIFYGRLSLQQARGIRKAAALSWLQLQLRRQPCGIFSGRRLQNWISGGNN